MILLILFIVLLIASIPAYPYSRGWGYGPMGFIVMLLVVLLILVLIGIIPIRVTQDPDGGYNVEVPKVNLPDVDIDVK
jgi:hypothetical protein